MTFQATLNFSTPGRGTTDITHDIQQIVAASGIETGLAHVFIHHTSASLMLCENADPDVLADLERFMTKLVPDGSPMFQHSAEGPDDMPAHVRSVITQTGLSMPVANGACDLGTWQGVYLWEHRIQAHQRRITVTVTG
jgi:secondary thiamine-phosphate synthase enzyme